MNNLPIGVIDSGIGGLSVLLELDEAFSNQTFIYNGDNDNAPYGEKNNRELLSRAISCIFEMDRFNVKTVVVACNTLSVNVLPDLEYYSQKKCFGVFPPVEKSVALGESVLLCTPRTAQNYYKVKGLMVLPLPKLAKDIEDNLFCADNIKLENHVLSAFDHFCYKNKIQGVNFYDFVKGRTLVLGCTHYVLIKNEFINHFQPQKILTSNEDTVFNLKKYLKNAKSLEKNKENRIFFIGNRVNLFVFNIFNANKKKKAFDFLRKKIKKN